MEEQPNLTYVHSMSGGDKEFERDLLKIIDDEFEKEKLIYFNNINAENFKETAQIVHKIKHKIGILGLERGYELAISYEDNLKQGKTSLREEFESILSLMSNYIKTL